MHSDPTIETALDRGLDSIDHLVTNISGYDVDCWEITFTVTVHPKVLKTLVAYTDDDGIRALVSAAADGEPEFYDLLFDMYTESL